MVKKVWREKRTNHSYAHIVKNGNISQSQDKTRTNAIRFKLEETPKESRKLSFKFDGPYQILRKVGSDLL